MHRYANKLAVLLLFPVACLAQGGIVGGSGTIGGSGQIGAASGGGGSPTFSYVAGSATGCFTAVSGTTCTYGLHVNTTTGNLLQGFVVWANGGGITMSIACTNNGTITAVGSQQNGTGTVSGFSYQNFEVTETYTGADTCTATTSAPSGSIIWELDEYAPSGSFTGLDGTAQYSQVTAASGTITISGLTTTGPNDLITASCMLVDTGSVCAVGSGYTLRNDTNACEFYVTCATGYDFNTSTQSAIEDKVNVASGPQTATFTGFTSGDVVTLGLVGFK